LIYLGIDFAAVLPYSELPAVSAREDVSDRAARRADKLRGWLGWEPGILNGIGTKPKWMRWRTFERLAAEHDPACLLEGLPETVSGILSHRALSGLVEFGASVIQSHLSMAETSCAKWR
jgi:hypothetical protein